MVDKYGTGNDPYTYGDTNVLINKFEITDSVMLEEAEKEFTELAAEELIYRDPPYSFDYLCGIHKALFGDLYEWAGEVRSIDISKGSTRFCSCNYIEKEANKMFVNLDQENYLANLDEKQFIAKIAEYYCDINVLHPFREGNGRAQRILFEHISINCGYNLNLSGITVTEWVNANISGYNCDYSDMEKIIEKCISPIEL